MESPAPSYIDQVALYAGDNVGMNIATAQTTLRTRHNRSPAPTPSIELPLGDGPSELSTHIGASPRPSFDSTPESRRLANPGWSVDTPLSRQTTPHSYPPSVPPASVSVPPYGEHRSRFIATSEATRPDVVIDILPAVNEPVHGNSDEATVAVPIESESTTTLVSTRPTTEDGLDDADQGYPPPSGLNPAATMLGVAYEIGAIESQSVTRDNQQSRWRRFTICMKDNAVGPIFTVLGFFAMVVFSTISITQQKSP